MKRPPQGLPMNVRIFGQFSDFLGESFLDLLIITLQSVLCGPPDNDTIPIHAYHISSRE